jgi:hypothetical protein
MEKNDIELAKLEYYFLRREIERDLDALLKIFIYGIIAVGAVFSYSAKTEIAWACLVGPIMVSAFLIYSATQLASIVRISTYLRLHIEQKLPGLRWENTMYHLVRKGERSSWPKVRNRHYWGVATAFNALALVCMIGAIITPQDSFDKAIVLMIIAMETALLFYANYTYYRATGNRRFEEEEKLFAGHLNSK